MVDKYRRQGALTHFHLGARALDRPDKSLGVTLAERPYLGQIAIRAEAADTPLREAIEAALGVALPRAAHTVNKKPRGNTVLWMGPDEWLAVSPAGKAPALLAKLGKSIGERHAAIVDVSESRTVIAIGGAHARDLLHKGCAHDLHPRAFGTDNCVQGHFALAHALIHQTSDAPTYDLYVHRSFAEYLFAWLEDAAAEYGLAILES